MKDEQTELLSRKRVSANGWLAGGGPERYWRLRAAKTGLTPENGPQVFLLVGPSGTGKTETALAADALFGGEKALITINLSEYRAAHCQPAEGFSAGLRRLRRRDPDRGGAQTPLQRGAAR